jgi:hypothetical protein
MKEFRLGNFLGYEQQAIDIDLYRVQSKQVPDSRKKLLEIIEDNDTGMESETSENDEVKSKEFEMNKTEEPVQVSYQENCGDVVQSDWNGFKIPTSNYRLNQTPPKFYPRPSIDIREIYVSAYRRKNSFRY